MKEKIIDYIKRNRVSTTEVADCLNKTGRYSTVSAVNRGHFKVGSVHWAYASGESNWNVHKMVRDVKEGDVVIVDAFGCKDRAILGELVAKYVLLYHQAAALVVNGNVRDVPPIMRENFAVWCKGFNPVGCFNNEDYEDIDDSVRQEYANHYNGSIAVCDDCGVVIIPKEQHTKEFLDKLIAMENQEDIWFDCLDRLHWDTYEIVCQKKYKEQRHE